MVLSWLRLRGALICIFSQDRAHRVTRLTDARPNPSVLVRFHPLFQSIDDGIDGTLPLVLDLILLLMAAIILMVAPGPVTWALALID